MITTKAYIVSLPNSGDNVFKVRVPLMEDNTGIESIFDALLCTDPSNYNGYSVGDCVFITYEDNLYNQAIIIGKLYTDVPNSSSSYNIVNELNVTDKVTLPQDTKIGDINVTEVLNNLSMSGSGSNIKYKETSTW